MEIKPLETSANIAYENSFDFIFSLILHEIRSTTLATMQEATVVVEENLLANEELKNIIERGEYKDRKKQK